MSDAPILSGAVPDGFGCTLDQSRAGVVRIVVTGEIDLATGPALDRQLRNAHVRGRLIVLDMREVSFCDSTGLHLILRAHQRACDEGRRLVIVSASQQVQRLFALTGVDRQLEIVEDVEQVTADSRELTPLRAGRTTRAA